MRSGMTVRHTSQEDRAEAGRYEIRLTGRLDARWAAWFDGLTVSHESDGTTVISGPIADQAALHGLLQRVRDLGLPLVSVTRDETDPPTTLGTGQADAADAKSKTGLGGLSTPTSTTKGDRE
jgi:hypothetical protein